ncbi:rho guanine nucleotide exchange factor TIAM2 isoform X2 [Protopterus annectens]|uniref:rho guanine nucleotide exchange factor TIAM2 isoform X2 n=1 Tax=Protopterus annectens TaxID=7888 RepID=UPI001CFB73C6|nr:rho guanine nucleotide exchange factor TIAM2 isoform X2 [Protopterus annectens]
MGNSESQYNLQGSRSPSIVFPGVKQKSLSHKIRNAHAKDEKARSSHGWGHSSNGTSFKARASGRSSLFQPKATQPYLSRHCDPVTRTPKSNVYVKHKPNMPGNICHGNNTSLLPENCFHFIDLKSRGSHAETRECNGHVLRNSGAPETVAGSAELEDRRSPKVLIKTLGKIDGCLRVEFHSASSHRLSPGDSNGPVQLLRYSPTPEMCSGNLKDMQRDFKSESGVDQSLLPCSSRLMFSKGSSSSDCSWYDSHWNSGKDSNELDHAYLTATSTDSNIYNNLLPNDNVKLFNQRSSLSSLRELYRDLHFNSMTSGKQHSAEYLGTSMNNRVSFESDLSFPSNVGPGGPLQYSSYTLPCRKSKPLTEDASRKDTLKNRMRRISDWTGSLSRKKRKLQEPRSKDFSDCFDSGVDGLTVDTCSPSQQSSSFLTSGSSHTLPLRSESSNAISSDTVRQNIYENFMQELEMGHANVEQTERSTETEESSSDSFISVEHLDLLFEKEQGVVRKAGWLQFKPLITLQKERKLELVPRRKWKQYWITLKGCTLLFYETYGRNSAEQNAAPRYALLAEDSIVQSVPEHPKKENVFCLSNAFGDVYLFQALNQTDLENWVTAIHSASASLFAKKHGKEDTIRLLKNQTKNIVQKIDMDSKMKKMAELQLSVVSDPKNRKAIENQIQQWEQNLEKFNIDLFRMRCYLASLQGGELPNPKSLLAAASRPSKMALGRLGIFSVSSFHALICSRDDTTFRKRSLSLSQRVRSKRGLFSSLKGLDHLSRKGREKGPAVPQHLEESVNVCCIPTEASYNETFSEPLLHVIFPDGSVMTVLFKPEYKVKDVLTLACKEKQLDPRLYGLLLKQSVGGTEKYAVPSMHKYLHEQIFDQVEVFPLHVYDLNLRRPDGVADFGFAVAGQADGHQCRQIFVSDVLQDGVAFSEGLRVDDEILAINGEAVSKLDHRHVKSLFTEKSVTLTLKSYHFSPKHASSSSSSISSSESSTDKEQKPHLPPYNQSQLLEEFFDTFARSTTSVADFANVPDVTTCLTSSATDGSLDQLAPGEGNEHLKSTEQATAFYQSLHELSPTEMDGQKEISEPPLRPLTRHLSDADRLRKVIQELVDTEKSYVKDLSCLFELYLQPLQSETFLTQDEMESLFGSLPEMLEFQKIFLQTLEDGIATSPDFKTLDTPSQFRKLLFSVGGSFLYYADHFKLYSGFCANHSKVQKVLERAKTDKAFKEFLDARNPTKQHSSTLESYLIKPVQRVLKYPLLLKELVSLTDPDSEEHYHLTEALKAMEKVASHINEMQKIYEDYGAVFDQLVAEQSGTEKEVTELSMGELLMYASVSWLNPFPLMGRMKRDPELTVFVFKRAVILVYKENCKLKKKMPTNARSSYCHGDTDPFKFRWLIPLSALQVRLGNAAGTENSCMWELIHTRSEVEGRPETIFQLCSSDSESKGNIVKVIRSILRENARRNILKGELPLEKICKDRLAPLRNRVPTSAKFGSSRSLKLSKIPSTECSRETTKKNTDSDECSLGSSTHSSSCHTTESSLDSQNLLHAKPFNRNTRDLRESDILSDDDDYCQTVKKETASMDIADQLKSLTICDGQSAEQKLAIEADATQTEQEAEHPRLVRAHFCPIKRKANSTKQKPAILLAMQAHSRSLDSQSDGASVDLSSILEREFSIQSLTSVVNEDCFYEPVENHGKPELPAL